MDGPRRSRSSEEGVARPAPHACERARDEALAPIARDALAEAAGAPAERSAAVRAKDPFVVVNALEAHAIAIEQLLRERNATRAPEERHRNSAAGGELALTAQFAGKLHKVVRALGSVRRGLPAAASGADARAVFERARKAIALAKEEALWPGMQNKRN